MRSLRDVSRSRGLVLILEMREILPLAIYHQVVERLFNLDFVPTKLLNQSNR
jgi:hypothetical protein